MNASDLNTADVIDVADPDDLLVTLDDLLSFGSLPPAHHDAFSEEKVTHVEGRILAWVGEACERAEALASYRHWHTRLQAALDNTQALVAALNDGTALDANAFSDQHRVALVEQRQQALLAEAQLQVFEGTLDAEDLRRLAHAVGLAPQPDENLRYLHIAIEDAVDPLVLTGALILTTEQGLSDATANEAALLYLSGSDGGLQKFPSLQALKTRLRLTLMADVQATLWRHVPAAGRQWATSDSVQLSTLVIGGQPIDHGVHTQLQAWVTDCEAAQAGERFFPGVDSLEESLARLQHEAALNLAVPRNEARQRALERIAEQQRTAELVPQLPAWLLTASPAVRGEYNRRLGEFQGAAALLEAHVEQALPSFESFTAQRVEARLKQDLGLDIDARQLIVDQPRSVHRIVDIDPQYGMPLHGQPWGASSERLRSSLAELARENLEAEDEQTAGRLSFLKISYPPAPQLAGLQQIDDQYLLRTLPALDVAGKYRALLRSVFRVRAAGLDADDELLLKPYELEILLEGFCARQRGRVTEAASSLLGLAARARSRAELNRAGVEMNWVLFKPGQAVSGERSAATLRGLCVIHQLTTGKTLIYLPQAPGGDCLLEASSLMDARERLINRLIQVPALVTWLASRIDEPGAPGTDESYIQQALRRGFQGFIAFVPALDMLITEDQLNVREWLLYRQTLAEGRSNHDLARERNLQRSQITLGYFRAVLSFLPGLGTLFSVEDGWRDSQAMVDAFGRGNLDEGLLLAGSTLLSVADILLSVVPGVAGASALALAARRATRLRQASRLAQALPSVSRKSYVIKRFAGYEAQVSLSGAIPQTGRDAQTWLKNGELFIYRQGQAYQVYRRSGEQTLRLKKTASQGYEQPVRYWQGEWGYHSEVGLSGGGRSYIAELTLVQAHGAPGFTRKEARQMLDQFEFPLDEQLRKELDLAEHYRQHKTLPQWAQAYRRTSIREPGAVAGKRKQPPSPSEPHARPVQPVAGTSRATGRADAWQHWGKSMGELSVPDPVSAQPPIYRLGSAPDVEVIRIDHKLYDIMPVGSQRWANTVFLRNPEVPCRSFAELNEVIRHNPYEQPVMATFNPLEARWNIVGQLFGKPIQALITDIRPGFTQTSARVLAEKLFDMADISSSTVTATRLVNLKATLNAWRKGHDAPLANLNDPLLMLNKAQPLGGGDDHLRLNLSYESSLGSFQRLDFTYADPVASQWLAGAMVDPTSIQGINSLRGLMTHVLSRDGYEVLHNQLHIHTRQFIAFRRPGQAHVYLLYMRRTSDSAMTTPAAGAFSEQSVGDAWADPIVQRHAGQPIAQTLAQASERGKLVKLLGGINSTSRAEGGTQVYVMRLSDHFSRGAR
jgi:hypothetical protein